jgi:16S rRNA (guanine966-N2)-methyltransferase
MRIVAGVAKGMPLAAPRAGVRPTADRVREAIFSSLGERVVGARVLDLYAGTGALGLEAASRGAVAVTFVESSRAALRSLDRNIAAFSRYPGARCEMRVVRADVGEQLRKLARAGAVFSLVFADPPYGAAAQRLLGEASVRKILGPGGLLVLESAAREALVVDAPWRLVREAVYGDTRVSFFAAG